MQVFCFKCRTKREIKDLEHVILNGRPATKAVCPICRTKLFKISQS